MPLSREEWACQILDIKCNSSLAQVNRAYHDLVLIWHPDRQHGNSRLVTIATEKLKKINLAREILTGSDFETEIPTAWQFEEHTRVSQSKSEGSQPQGTGQGFKSESNQTSYSQSNRSSPQPEAGKSKVSQAENINQGYARVAYDNDDYGCALAVILMLIFAIIGFFVHGPVGLALGVLIGGLFRFEGFRYILGQIFGFIGCLIILVLGIALFYFSHGG